MEFTVKDMLEKLLEPSLTMVHLFDIDNDICECTADEAIMEYGDYIVEEFSVGTTVIDILVS